MTIQELIDQLQAAIKDGYKPDTRICVDTMDGDSHWSINLDTDSSGYPDKDQWKIAINVYEDKVWKERYEKLTVHCLKCDDIFRETEPPAKVCPNCGNTDKNKTVYLQGEQDEQNQLRLHDLL